MDNNLNNDLNELNEENQSTQPTVNEESQETVEDNAVAAAEVEESSPALIDDPEDACAPAKSVEPSQVYTYRWDYQAQQDNDAENAKRKGRKGLLTYAVTLSVAFLISIATLIGVMIFDKEPTPTPPSSSGVSESSLADLYEFCLPSSVAISTFSESGAEGAGSGVIITEDGYICTNQHVVEDAKTIKVILSNEKMYTAEYIDGDELNDIAIIKINVKGLTPAILGSSQNSRVGDKVMAIGTPYGIEYRFTMTSGSISALNRQHVQRNDSGTVNKVQTLIQTDTSVNPGNSGGPLFNMQGEVIGIVAMKIAGSSYEGMGFAIPMETVIDMINDIIANGKITDSSGGAKEGAALGISGFAVEEGVTYMLSGDYHFIIAPHPDTGVQSVKYPVGIYVEEYVYIPLGDTATLAEYGIDEYTLYTAPKTGILIMTTTLGFPSAEMLRVNDIILSVNGITCDQMSVIQSLIAGCSVGDELQIEIYRNGVTMSVSVALGRSSAMEE